MICELENVGWQRDRTILNNIQLTVRQGEHWVLLGPNGCGKSTILRMMSLREWPTRGRVRLFGKEFPGHPVFATQQRIGLFETRQIEGLIENYPSLTILETVLLGMNGTLPRYVPASQEEIQRATAMIREELPENLKPDVSIATLSAGERRRVLLLHCLASLPDFLLLDEPFENLDIAAQLGLEDQLARTLSEVSASVLVVHRIQEIPPRISHAALLHKGSILSAGLCEDVLTSENVSRAYEIPLRLSVERRPFRQYRWSRT